MNTSGISVPPQKNHASYYFVFQDFIGGWECFVRVDEETWELLLLLLISYRSIFSLCLYIRYPNIYIQLTPRVRSMDGCLLKNIVLIIIFHYMLVITKVLEPVISVFLSKKRERKREDFLLHRRSMYMKTSHWV